MAKKKQTLIVTNQQKLLGLLMLVSALLYLFYHGTMSVLNRQIVYEGIWPTLWDVTFWLAVGTGALYVGYLFFVHPMKRDMWRDFRKKVLTTNYLLLLILLVLMIFSVASIKSAFPSGDWWKANRTTVMDTAGQILVLFPFGCWLVRHRDAKEFRIPLHVFSIAFLILEVWILVRTFTNSPIYLANGGGIGINGEISLIINCNRNTTGLWGYCFLFLCIYLAVTTVKWMKLIYILGIPVNLLIIALSMSRASLYASCLMLGLFAAIWFWYQKHIFTEKKKTKIIGSVFVGIAVTVVFYFLDGVLREIYLEISNIEALLGVDATEREFFDTRLSGRTDVWMASLKALTYDARSFFFGVSPIGIYSRIEELMGTSLYTHNQILEFGVGSGVPAMIIFIIFCVRLFLHSVKVCFTSGNRSMRNTLASVGCFLMLIANMFEATLFGFNYLSGIIFIVACGYLTELSRNPALMFKEQEQRERIC